MQPALLPLEDRKLLSTIVVNNPTDTPVTGQIDVRQAIVQANTNGGTETITFDKTVFKTPQTINLTGGQLELSDTTGTEAIVSPPAGVTVNGGGNSRVFQVDTGVTASISGMTITGGGNVLSGGGVANSGSLTVDDCHFVANQASEFGGGLLNSGHIDLLDSSFTGNSAATTGGGMSNSFGASGSISGSSFSGNRAKNGGGIDVLGSALTIANTTITGNTAVNGGGLDAEYATTTLTKCTISGNSGTATDVAGAARNSNSARPT